MKKQEVKKPKFYKKTAEQKKEEKRQKEVQVFPSIPREIPEPFHVVKFILNKYFLVSFVSTFLSVAIALQGLDMVRDMQRLREAQSKKQEILREIAYWEGVTRQYDDYRDGYFRLALLEYQLNNAGYYFHFLKIQYYFHIQS